MGTVTTIHAPKELTAAALDQVIGGAVGAATTTTPSLGDFAARFVCFPPIDTIIGANGCRAQSA